MKQFIKKFNNSINKILFNVKNKTNNNFLVRKFNNSIIKIIFKVKNKTNNNQLISKFNNSIIKTIFKVKNQTNNNFLISNFNKYLITFISLLFLYLFYLSIPVLYDKTWIQSNIEQKLSKEFKTNFSISHDVSYRILPSPHFLIKDSKIIREDSDKMSSFADIKILKVFIDQKNFFNKDKITLKYIKIDKANFSIFRDDYELLKNSNDSMFSNKKIKINKSNIFFKDDSDKTIAIIKISKAFLLWDKENLSNLFNLKGKIFNIPFTFDFIKKFKTTKSQEIHITAKTLKLDILDIYNNRATSFSNGRNIISLLKSSINSNYKIDKDIIFFDSNNSRIKNIKVDYEGNFSIDPFDLNINININNYKLFEMLNNNSILNELIKTQLLFNENISISTTITAASNSKKEFFENAIVHFNVTNGKINLNKTRLINEKIGSLEIANSNLFFKNESLILNADVMIDISNTNELFSFLQTNKKSRKSVKNILVNMDYDFSNNKIEFNNFKINNQKVTDELLRIIEGFNDNKFNNLIKSRRLLNSIFEAYEG